MNSQDSCERPIPAVVGPTASGKSALGINLALELGGEVINLDSVQVYRRIEIATAKTTIEERRGIPHHLIDVVEPDVNFTAGDWARAAVEIIRDIESRGRIPFLVGGSGFYLRALVDGLFEGGPETDPALRRRLTERFERRGPERLHRLLGRFDPASAARLAPRDRSRVVRALEVFLKTGRPLSEWHMEADPRPLAPEIARRVRVIALAPPRERLYRRIDARADQMFAAGLVDEVRALLDEGLAPDAKAFGAHGYRRVVEHLLGLRTLESTVEQTKLDTRHYAKRQWTWWRSRPDVHWTNAFGESPEALDDALLYLGQHL